MNKLIKVLLPVLLTSSCSPLEINIAMENATLADKVYNYLENDWYSDIFYKDVDLKDAAIAQFISSISNTDVSKQLDPYTYVIKNEETLKDFTGKIGITSTVTFNYPVISKINDYSEAKGKLEIGDIIYGIGKEETGGTIKYHYISEPLYNVSTLLNYGSGMVGDKVYYRILRYEDNKFNTYDYTFTLRDPVEESSAYLLDCDVDDSLMVKLTKFDANITASFAKILKDNEESENKKHNLIIDLRDNGGGRVNSSIECCDLLLEGEKKVLSIVNKNQQVSEYTTGNKLGDYLFDKYVILTNENTASASEIMIKCLDYYYGDKLTIIGNKTFGKGLVTNTVYLDDKKEYSLQYLAGKWLDPSNAYMEYKTGITPDYTIDRKDYYTFMNGYNSYIDYSSNLVFDTVSNANYMIAYILNAKYGYDIRVDGYYDNAYVNYVKEYQTLKNIEDKSGSIDEETYLYLVYDYYLARCEFENSHINKIKEVFNG